MSRGAAFTYKRQWWTYRCFSLGLNDDKWVKSWPRLFLMWCLKLAYKLSAESSSIPSRMCVSALRGGYKWFCNIKQAFRDAMNCISTMGVTKRLRIALDNCIFILRVEREGNASVKGGCGPQETSQQNNQMTQRQSKVRCDFNFSYTF